MIKIKDIENKIRQAYKNIAEGKIKNEYSVIQKIYTHKKGMKEFRLVLNIQNDILIYIWENGSYYLPKRYPNFQKALDALNKLIKESEKNE